MATDISLGNLIVPTLFTPYVNEQSVVKNGLLKSGIIANDPLISGKLAGGGQYASILTFQNLDATDSPANATTSDQSVTSTPTQVNAHVQKFVRLGRNKSFSQADWDASLLGQDPMAFIGAMVVDAQMQWRQNSLISLLSGLAASAVTATSSSANVISVETSGYSAANQINAASIGATVVGAWGDYGSRDMLMDGTNGVVIFMHSKTYQFLSKTDYTSFQRQSIQAFGFVTYLGYPVVIDDTLPVRAGTTSGHVYTTVLARTGAIRFGYSAPKNATEVWRNPDAGNGGGADKLYQRDNFAFHVNGFSFTGALASDNVTDAQLATGTNWTQVLTAKQTGVAFLEHNLDV